MEIYSDIVGKKLKEYRTQVQWRHSTNYAAAVEDTNPCYLDDSRAEGIITPPTFITALTWPVIANVYDYLDLGYSPEVLLTMVHYSEYIEIHRPLCPGDSLTITGEVAAVLPHPKGSHVVFKFPAVDATGTAVFTEYIGGMLRGVQCLDAGRGAENLPAPLTVAAGQEQSLLWEVPVLISRSAPYIYDGCSEVAFPIHTSPSFAHSVGLPDIIYHGVATLAHAVRELVNREIGGEAKKVKSLSCTFKGMVLPDTKICIQLLKRLQTGSGIALQFRVLNDQEREAVSSGYLYFCE